MSEYTAIMVGMIGIIFLLLDYTTKLADRTHQMLKYGINAFALVLGYVAVLMMNFIAGNTGVAGLITMTGNLIKIYGSGMILIFTYLLFSVLFALLDWKNWHKKRDPFSDTEKRYFR